MSACGTRSAYAAGCRCDPCRAANATYATAYNRARGVPPRQPAKCGTRSKYNRGCRCDECRTANRESGRPSRRLYAAAVSAAYRALAKAHDDEYRDLLAKELDERRGARGDEEPAG